MPALNVLAQLLLIVGGLNWGLIGLLDFDLVKAIFGGTVGIQSPISRIVYILVGVAALYGFMLLSPLANSATTDVHRRT